MTENINIINEIVYFYKIVSKDNNYRYVGKTINFHKRLAQHIQACYDNKIKLKLYKTIRDNNYWWNFDMILVDTKYNITNKQVQETEQYYIDYYDCNLNSCRAKRYDNYYKEYQKQYAIENTDKIKEKNKKYNELRNATIRSIILIKDIINYNDNSSDKVKLYYELLKYLHIDLKRDYDKNILNRYVIDNSKKNKFLTGFKNDILNEDFMSFINNELLPDFNNNHKIGSTGKFNYKKIEIEVLDINNLKEIKHLISHYLKHLNLYIDYGHNIQQQSRVANNLQFTIQRYNKNIMLNYPNKKVKFIHYLQEEQIIIYKDIDEIETINDNIIIKPNYNIGRHNVDKKYYDKNINYLQQEQFIIYKDIDEIETINNNIFLKPLSIIEEKEVYEKRYKTNIKVIKYYDKNNKLNSELYMSYNNNECIKERRFYNKYYDDTTREKVLNFIKNQVKIKPLNKYIKTDYQSRYYNDIIPDNFDKMNNVFTELLKTDDELIVIYKDNL
jgi:hypothetical protein